MEYRPLDITVISAKDLKDVNLFSKMDVYVTVSINGDPRTQQKTPVDKNCGTKAKWHYNMKFTIDEASAQQNRLSLVFHLKSDRNLGDRVIGEVRVPVKELLDQKDGGGSSSSGKVDHVVTYNVRLPNGKDKGTLDFSYKFGEKFAASNPQPPPSAKKVDDPVMAYPPSGYAGSSSAYPPPGGHWQQPPMSAYPPPPPGGVHYPPPPGAYPPPNYGYGGYPPAAAPGYGYPPQGMGGYGYPMQQPQKPKKNKMGGMGLGLGAGLLGGLLVGDMISDMSDASAYDAGYMDGMDGGGMDF